MVFCRGLGRRFRAGHVPFNRNMVRLKLAVTSTKHGIGVVFNRNVNEGGVVWIFRLVGGLLGLEKSCWRLEDGELVGI